jgi:hypothetical protein
MTDKEAYLEAAEFFWGYKKMDQYAPCKGHAAHLCDAIWRAVTTNKPESKHFIEYDYQIDRMINTMAELFMPKGKQIGSMWWTAEELREERTMVLLFMAEMS